MQISVIIPTYNRSTALLESLDSCLSQTAPPHEVFVVDDGSTDDTRQVLEPFIEDGRIRYLYQENQGPAAARNTGIAEVTGDWLAFLDSDDLWLPNKLERQQDFVEKHPGVDIFFSNMLNMDEAGRSTQAISDRYAKRLAENPFRYIAFQNEVPLSSLLVSMKAVEASGMFDIEFFNAQDWEFLLRLATRHGMAYQHEVLVSRRRLGDNLVGNIERLTYYSIKVLSHRLENTEDAELRRYLADGLGHQRMKKGKLLLAQKRWSEADEILSQVPVAPMIHHGKAPGTLYRKAYARLMKTLAPSSG